MKICSIAVTPIPARPIHAARMPSAAGLLGRLDRLVRVVGVRHHDVLDLRPHARAVVVVPVVMPVAVPVTVAVVASWPS